MKIAYIGVMNSIEQPDNGFTKAMRKIGQYQEFKRVDDIDNADLLFLQTQDSGLDVNELDRLRNNGTFIINWTGDARHETPAYCYEYASHVDLTCFSNYNDVMTMREHGFNSDFLQIGYDETIYSPDGEKYDAPEIVFMGNNFGHFPLSDLRVQMVNFLQATYGDIFGVYGNSWPNGRGNYNGDQNGEACVYRGAKIGINLSHFDYIRYTSDRMFRMLGSGICVLSHKFKQSDWDFIDNKHLCYWNSLDELRNHIDNLLANDAERIRIATNGNQLALNTYTFQHMAEDIVTLYKENTVTK